jgi:hypothetical protein
MTGIKRGVTEIQSIAIFRDIPENDRNQKGGDRNSEHSGF